MGYGQVSHKNAQSPMSVCLCSGLRLSSLLRSSCTKPLRSSEMGKPCTQYTCHVRDFTPAARISCMSSCRSFPFWRGLGRNQDRQAPSRCKQEAAAGLSPAKKNAQRGSACSLQLSSYWGSRFRQCKHYNITCVQPINHWDFSSIFQLSLKSHIYERESFLHSLL